MDLHPTLTGTNDLTTEINRIYASEILKLNTAFLQAEAIAYMKQVDSEYVFDEERVKTDVGEFIEAYVMT